MKKSTKFAVSKRTGNSWGLDTAGSLVSVAIDSVIADCVGN